MKEFKTQREMAEYIAAIGCDGLRCADCVLNNASNFKCVDFGSESQAAEAYLTSLEPEEEVDEDDRNVSMTFDTSLITSLTINGVAYVFDEETRELVVKR